MNINVDKKMLAKIKAQLEQEIKETPVDQFEQALESADDIRRSIDAIHGDRYGTLIEVGVLVRKNLRLLAALTSELGLQGVPAPLMTVVKDVATQINAHLLSHAANLYQDQFSQEDSKQMTEWIDRICNAEDAAMEVLEKDIFKR